jgi:hypothetical protein
MARTVVQGGNMRQRVSMQIDLVFFSGCPHVPTAREQLREALTEAAMPLDWREWDTEDPATPAAFRQYASPTILVDGVDVERKLPLGGMACSTSGGPCVAQLRRAFASATPTRAAAT